jgi:hypothetical protein
MDLARLHFETEDEDVQTRTQTRERETYQQQNHHASQAELDQDDRGISETKVTDLTVHAREDVRTSLANGDQETKH